MRVLEVQHAQVDVGMAPTDLGQLVDEQRVTGDVHVEVGLPVTVSEAHHASHDARQQAGDRAGCAGPAWP